MKGYALYPIGIVRSEIREPMPPERFKNRTSIIAIDESYREALEGITKGKKVLVLFIFHRSHGFSVKVHPKGEKGRPLKGLFSTCSPSRPNPVGATVVEVIEKRGCLLTVKGLDAIDETPVIDIKPVHIDEQEYERGR